MSSIPLDIINHIIPRPTLQDLHQGQSDIDNDIDYLLNWLSPYFPSDLASNCKKWREGLRFRPYKPGDTSQRLKSAIRTCLKDDSNQVEFVKLYINSINDKFHQFFTSTDFGDFEFLDYYHLITIVLGYYEGCISYMNLNLLSKDLFHRNLNGLFRTYLIRQNNSDEASPFLGLLQDYLNEWLFDEPLLVNPPAVINPVQAPSGDDRLNSSFGPLRSSPIAKALYSPNKSPASPIDVVTTLFSLNLTNEINYILIRLSIQKIQDFIHNNCASIWNVPLLDKISQFIQNEVYPNFSIILSFSTDAGLTDKINNAYLYELIKIAYDELVSLRIKEIFDLVTSYPHNQCGLEELHHCLSIKYNHDHYNDRNHQDHFDPSTTHSHNLINEVTNLSSFSNLANYSLKTQSYQRKKLVDTFIELSHSNLLHSGSNTVDVITSYTKTINSFLIIDPKGVLLDKVVRPIRRYLKTREDIIIKLVHGLLDEEDTSKLGLSKELRKRQETKRNGNYNNSFIEDSVDLNWFPDPIDALPDFKKGKVSDIIESLISIFDSKDIFIDEFTKLFGQKLIELHNYNVYEIGEHLDLLKSRFGKSEFTVLDIMIRDIRESKIINDAIAGRSSSDLKFHTSILSHLYWNNLEKNELEVPQIIQEKFQEYNDQFSKLKRGRNLKFVPNLGLVKLNLKFKNNRTLHFEVSPDKAAIISLFNDEDNELSVDFIANKLGMNQYSVSKGLSFWVQQKVLMELTKTLYIINDEEDEESLEEYINPPSSAHSSSNAQSSDNGTDELTILWPHLHTILENITSLSFERIKSLLKLTVPKEKYDLSKVSDSKLEEFLDSLVDQNKLLLSAGTYKLKK